MHYATRDRLLRRHQGRAIAFQILSGLVIGALLVPMAYQFGKSSHLEKFDASVLQPFAMDTPAPPPTEAPLPRSVERALLPFGDTGYESSSVGEAKIYRSFYAEADLDSPTLELDRIARKWYALGFEITRSRDSLSGSQRDGVYTGSVKFIRGQGLEIFIREKDQSAATSNDAVDRMIALGLPLPPRDHEISDLGGVIVLQSRRAIMPETERYDRLLRGEGWSPVDGRGFDKVETLPINILYRQQEGQTLMLTSDEGPRGGTVITLVVF